MEHQHLIVRFETTTPHTKEEQTIEWLRALIEAINMKILLGPHAIYCEKAGNRGMTGFAIIETSHVAFHMWDESLPAVGQLDIYTCSTLDVQDVVARIKREFNVTRFNHFFIDRKGGLQLMMI